MSTSILEKWIFCNLIDRGSGVIYIWLIIIATTSRETANKEQGMLDQPWNILFSNLSSILRAALENHSWWLEAGAVNHKTTPPLLPCPSLQRAIFALWRPGKGGGIYICFGDTPFLSLHIPPNQAFRLMFLFTQILLALLNLVLFMKTLVITFILVTAPGLKRKTVILACRFYTGPSCFVDWGEGHGGTTL